MDLRDVHPLLVAEIRTELGVVAAAHPISVCGETFEHLSELCQALAICHFTTQGDVVEFRENLARSGQARRYYLQRSSEEANTASRHLAISRSEAVLDGVVSDRLDIAREIVALSPDDWVPDGEYEDDYSYFAILHALINPAAVDPVLEQHLARFETALEGADSPRLSVCRALASGDDRAFDEALRSLLDEREDRLAEKRSRAVESDLTFWPQTYVCIEGLALISLARGRGLTVAQDFPLCPAVALEPGPRGGRTDVFAQIEAELTRLGQRP